MRVFILSIFLVGCCIPQTDEITRPMDPTTVPERETPVNPFVVASLGFSNDPSPKSIKLVATAIIVSQRYAVTCHHCIWSQGQGSKYIAIYEPGKKVPVRLPVKIVRTDEQHDLALLEFDYDRPVSIAKLAPAYQRDPNGFYNGKAHTRQYPYVVGNVWYKSGRYDVKQEVFETTLRASDVAVVVMKGEVPEPGDSGSGVFNSNGQLVGLVNYMFSGMVGIVTVDKIRTILDEEDF